MYTVYILKSESTGKYYTGHTNNLERRLAEHNQDLSFSTKNRGPWKLIYQETFETRAEAMRRERFFKTGKGRDFISRISPDSSAG